MFCRDAATNSTCRKHCVRDNIYTSKYMTEISRLEIMLRHAVLKYFLIFF